MSDFFNKDATEREIMNALIKLEKNGYDLDLMTEREKRIELVVEKAVYVDPWQLLKADESFRDSRNVMLAAICGKPDFLKYATERLREDPSFVSYATKQNGATLEYAGENLKNNKDFVLEAIENNSDAFRYASENLRSHSEVVKKAVRLNGYNLMYAGENPKKDKETVLIAVEQNGLCLQYAAEELLDDKDIVLAAIKQTGSEAYVPLRLASERLKMDPEVVKTAVALSGHALQFANPAFLEDRKMVLLALKENGNILGSLKGDFRNDFDLNLAAVKSNSSALDFVDRKLAGDEKVNMDRCRKIARERNVEYMVHFTFLDNLNSILENGILTREEIENGVCGIEKYKNCFVTDYNRFDQQLHTVCLSVTKTNESMFSAKRFYYELDEKNWCVIRMKAEDILNHECLFFANHAACADYDDVENGVKKAERNTVFDFASMFNYRKEPDGMTEDVQAEILCVGRIPVEEIESVIFCNEEIASKYRSELNEKNIRALVNKVDTKLDYFF